MCGINAVGAQGCGCMSTFYHAPLKIAVLLHKMPKVLFVLVLAVSGNNQMKQKSVDVLTLSGEQIKTGKIHFCRFFFSSLNANQLRFNLKKDWLIRMMHLIDVKVCT